MLIKNEKWKMDNEKVAIQRRLADQARFCQGKEDILIELGCNPSELLKSSAPERLRRKLDNNLSETASSHQQFWDQFTPLEDPINI